MSQTAPISAGATDRLAMVTLGNSNECRQAQALWHGLIQENLNDAGDTAGQALELPLDLEGERISWPAVVDTWWHHNPDPESAIDALLDHAWGTLGTRCPPLLILWAGEKLNAKMVWGEDADEQEWLAVFKQPEHAGLNTKTPTAALLQIALTAAVESNHPSARAFRAAFRSQRIERWLPQPHTPPKGPRF